jgi:predicted nicotinamide N-methyase
MSPAPPPALRRALETTLPHVRLALQPVPGPASLALWLLAPDAGTHPVKGEAARRLAEAPPYWSLCWAAGIVTAAYLMEHPALVRGKTVVDFGAGSGVVALAAARAGAGRVVALDCDPVALAACRANALENGVTLECAADLDAVGGAVDLVTVADVFYDAANLPLLPRLRARAGAVLAADSRRRDLTAHGLTPLGAVRACTLPDFGDPQFESVALYRA